MRHKACSALAVASLYSCCSSSGSHLDSWICCLPECYFPCPGTLAALSPHPSLPPAPLYKPNLSTPPPSGPPHAAVLPSQLASPSPTPATHTPSPPPPHTGTKHNNTPRHWHPHTPVCMPSLTQSHSRALSFTLPHTLTHTFNLTSSHPPTPTLPLTPLLLWTCDSLQRPWKTNI